MVDWSAAVILIDNDNGFTDGNDRSVRALDVVEYRFGARRGILLEALHDGDAFVLFRDTKKIENVKWHHLCKVPLIDDDAAGERERCALIVEQSAGFPTHKLRNRIAAAIRDPNTFYEQR